MCVLVESYKHWINSKNKINHQSDFLELRLFVGFFFKAQFVFVHHRLGAKRQKTWYNVKWIAVSIHNIHIQMIQSHWVPHSLYDVSHWRQCKRVNRTQHTIFSILLFRQATQMITNGKTKTHSSLLICLNTPNTIRLDNNKQTNRQTNLYTFDIKKMRHWVRAMFSTQ